jgi:hypothetical protein
MKLIELYEGKKIESRNSEISFLEAVDFIKANCSEIVKVYKASTKHRIYRGIPGKYDSTFLWGNSTKTVRQSRNTLNYYTLIMDNSNQWKKYPKRSESFICSSESYYARDFGKLFVAFPVDGTKIGVCPKFDLWGSSEDRYNSNDYSEFNDALKSLGKYVHVKINENNYKKFKEDVELIGKKVKEKLKNKDAIKDILRHDYNEYVKKLLVKNIDDLYGFLETVFSPGEFKLVDTSSYNVTGRHELWFSGNVIFVQADPIYMGPTEKEVKNKDGKVIGVKSVPPKSGAGNYQKIDEFIEAL